METFDELLEISTRIHGHICAGQVIGVRMSILGLKLLNIDDPKGKDRKKIYVVVEIDRCATDAIQSVTGCSLGKRTLKWLDHGVMAATFVNLDTNLSYRITAREEARELSEKYSDNSLGKYERQLEAYKIMPENELFKVEEVILKIPDSDMPGKPLRRVQCAACGDWVQDCREIQRENETHCKKCTEGSYFSVKKK